MSRPHARSAALAAALSVVLACMAPPVLADEAPDDPTGPAGAREPVPLWELGLFAIGGWSPAYPGSDQNIGKVRVLPYGVWRGGLLRVENGGVGLRALRTPRFEWDVSASGAFGAAANQVHARDGMPAIGTLVEIGPALRVNLGDLVDAARDPRATRLELPVRAVFDASDGFAHVGWTFEPRFAHTAWRNESMALSLSAGALFGDRKLGALFYGVDPAYATPDRPAYAARAGLVATRVGASLAQRVSATVRLRWFAQLESVRGAANEASPLVRRHEDGGVGVSVTWGAFRSSEVGVE